MRFFLFLLIVVSACGRSDARPIRAVDSVVSIDTALARFRQGLREPPGLERGANSLTDLIASFVSNLERADTAGLVALALTREEFAFLYYPTVPEARPPYELSPGLMWFMLEGNSARGLSSLLAERGGQPLGYAGVRCDGEPRRHGENVLYPTCLISRTQAEGDTVGERLFGPIVERHGVLKFVSYANKL